MAPRVYEGLGIDFRPVDHDREETADALALAAYDGNGLASFNLLPHLDQVLGVAPVNGFKSVVMSDDDDIAICGEAA